MKKLLIVTVVLAVIASTCIVAFGGGFGASSPATSGRHALYSWTGAVEQLYYNSHQLVY